MFGRFRLHLLSGILKPFPSLSVLGECGGCELTEDECAGRVG